MSIADLATILAHAWGPGPRPTPTELFPAPWPDAPRVDDGYVDTTPANLGLDDDIVAHALHALGKFGELTLREARILLSQWARRDQLTDAQVAEVLAYYQPTPALKAVA